MDTKRALFSLSVTTVVLAAGILMAQGPPSDSQPNAKTQEKKPPREPNQSPASLPRPKAASPQAYTAEQIRTGESRFAAECGFCHGRDATGGESGPDLTRSDLAARDLRGDKLGPLVRAGREDKGMPAFKLNDSELISIVAFIHSQMEKLAGLGGGRRSVEPGDLASGNAADGRAYFNGSGRCTACHSPTGDLAGVAKRHEGLPLLQRMLYPATRPETIGTAKAVFTLASGQTVVAPFVAEDEFSVVVLDPLGVRQTYSRDAVKVRIDNPLSAHFEQLGKYTDADIHNLYAYLSTLK